jgi:hypothetical protein
LRPEHIALNNVEEASDLAMCIDFNLHILIFKQSGSALPACVHSLLV